MSNNNEEAVLHIITALSGTLGEDALIQAPKFFAQIATSPGLSQILIGILQDNNRESNVRIQSSVLLKQLILDNWNRDDITLTEQEEETLENAHFSPEMLAMAQKIANLRGLQSELSIDDKNFLKNSLPSLLSNPFLPIRSNIAYCIATIGSHDFPDKWPGLLQGLIQAAQHTDPNVVQGGLLCFNMLLDEVIDTTIQTVAIELFSTLLVILNNPATIPSVRVQALDLYSAFLHSFSIVEDQHEKGFEKKHSHLILPTLPNMLNTLLSMIDAPINVQNSDSCQFETRGAAMKAITRLVTYFPVTTKSAIDCQHILLDRILNAFHSTVTVYIDNMVIAPPDMLPEDAVTNSLSFFINCIISFIDIMTESTKHFPKYIMQKLDRLLPSMIYALLLNNDTVDTYHHDLNQFTVDENTIDYDIDHESLMSVNQAEKSAASRTECNRFIKIAIHKWSKSGPNLVAKLAAELWQRGQSMKTQFEANGTKDNDKNAFWWKFQEASLICIGRLISSEKGYELESVQATFPIAQVVEMIYSLAQTQISPTRQDEVYLQARAMWLIGHCIRYLTAQMTTQLHRNKQYDMATQTQALVTRCLGLLPHTLVHCPLETQITAAHAIATSSQSFIAIDHSVLMYQCQVLNDQFYSQHPQLKADYDACMKSGQPIPLQQQFVNTIPVNFNSSFAQHFPIYLERFCFLLQNVQDQGMIAIVECILWIMQFFTQWRQQVEQLSDMFPYIQFNQQTPPQPPQQPQQQRQPQQPQQQQPGQLLPQLEPHVQTLTPELMSNVIATILNLWLANSNNQTLAEGIVDIFHTVAELKNNHIESWAANAYNILFQFVQQQFDPNGTPGSPSIYVKDTHLTDAGAKMASIGLISIILRCLSPGPFSANTTTNLDPNKQQIVPLITSVQQLLETISTTPCSFQPIRISQVIPVEQILHNFLPTVVQIGLSCQDKSLVFGCVAITSSILAMYSSYLLPMYSNQQQAPPLFSMIKHLALSLIRTGEKNCENVLLDSKDTKQTIQDVLEIKDTDSPIACRLIAQLLISYKSVIGDESWKELLNLIIMKLCTTTDYQLQYPCVLIIARVGIHHCSALIHYLATECGSIQVKKLIKRGELVRNKKTGRMVQKKDEYDFVSEPIFARTISVFLKTVELLSSGYIRRIVMLFLCQCMSDPTCVQHIYQLPQVQDKLIKIDTAPATTTTTSPFAKSGPITRSKGTVIESYTYCNPITKIIKLICDRGYQALLLNAESVNYEDSDGLGLFDDDDDDDTDDEGGDDHDEESPGVDENVLQALFGQGGLKSGEMTLDEIFDDNDNDDDDNGDDFGSDRTDYPESPYDRFYGVDIALFVSSFVKNQDVLMAANQGPFALVKDQLGPEQFEQFLALKDPDAFIQQYKLKK
jgi:hypothetical protein